MYHYSNTHITYLREMHSSITVFEDLNHLNYCFIKNKIGIRRECQGLGKSEFYEKKYILASSVMTYIIPYVVPFTTIHKVLVVIFALSSKNV